jgi:hypothetical protein
MHHVQKEAATKLDGKLLQHHRHVSTTIIYIMLPSTFFGLYNLFVFLISSFFQNCLYIYLYSARFFYSNIFCLVIMNTAFVYTSAANHTFIVVMFKTCTVASNCIMLKLYLFQLYTIERHVERHGCL